MKLIDRILQRWRIYKVLPSIPKSSYVLDIGCFAGELFQLAGKRIYGGLGIDPLLSASFSKSAHEDFTYVKGVFPDDMPVQEKKFDAIVILAVFEHIPENMINDFISACFNILNEYGRVILTIPCPFVDKILIFLRKLRLIDGMSLEEHHEFPVGGIFNLFEKHAFKLLKHSKFQFGLNNLFVFEKKSLNKYIIKDFKL